MNRLYSSASPVNAVPVNATSLRPAQKLVIQLSLMVKLLAVVCVLMAAVGLDAQQGLLQEGALRDWTSQRDMLLKIAAAMPEEKFGYRPTPAQRTWGEQILHIAQANVNQMGRLGSKRPAPAIDMKLTSPAAILKALADSFDYGTAVLEEQTDATLIRQAGNTPADRFMGPSAGIRAVYYVLGHTWDIYGQMVVYLRLNGITPPASQRF
jgi:uncharacterized damage-inducible protein DinB